MELVRIRIIWDQDQAAQDADQLGSLSHVNWDLDCMKAAGSGGFRISCDDVSTGTTLRRDQAVLTTIRIVWDYSHMGSGSDRMMCPVE